jgi:peroxiredoxin
LGVEFENKDVFGGIRGKRYALLVENGKVTEAHVEPDSTGLNGELNSIVWLQFTDLLVSAADKVLK